MGKPQIYSRENSERLTLFCMAFQDIENWHLYTLEVAWSESLKYLLEQIKQFPWSGQRKLLREGANAHLSCVFSGP